MDKLNNDRFAKEIMQNSRLEITTANFDQLLMRKIMAESRKRNLASNILLYILIFISVDVILFAILKLLNVNTSGLTNGLALLTNKVSFLVKTANNTFADNQVLVYAIICVLFLFSIIKGLISSPRSA